MVYPMSTNKALMCGLRAHWIYMCIYSFLAVIKADAHRCSTSNMAELTAQEGLIASVVSQETACGTYKSPWKIKVSPGQRINITLHDFSTVSIDGDNTGSLPEAACIAYASIREANTRPFTLCGGKEGKSVAYKSKTNNVEIIIQGTHANQRHFLLHYQGKNLTIQFLL